MLTILTNLSDSTDMTVREIHESVNQFKEVSRSQLYNYFSALKIEPIGARQRPQRFPDNSANRVLVHLGFVPPVHQRFAADASSSAGNGANHRQSARIPTMPELRATRKKARAK
jgi:hypothetical protein